MDEAEGLVTLGLTDAPLADEDGAETIFSKARPRTDEIPVLEEDETLGFRALTNESPLFRAFERAAHFVGGDCVERTQ